MVPLEKDVTQKEQLKCGVTRYTILILTQFLEEGVIVYKTFLNFFDFIGRMAKPGVAVV